MKYALFFIGSFLCTLSFAQPQKLGVVTQAANTVTGATVEKSQNNPQGQAAQAKQAASTAPVKPTMLAQPTSNVEVVNIPGTTAPPTLDSPIDSLLNEDLIRSLRDPFQLPSVLAITKETPKSDLEVYPLKDLRLNGIVTGPKKTRAMITTPSNKVFFVRVGDRIGVREGKVTQINPDSIKILEYYIDDHGKKMPDMFELTMSGDVISLSKKE